MKPCFLIGWSPHGGGAGSRGGGEVSAQSRGRTWAPRALARRAEVQNVNAGRETPGSARNTVHWGQKLNGWNCLVRPREKGSRLVDLWTPKS